MSVAELYTTCRTYRRFHQKPVPLELLKTLVDVAHKRSTGRNYQRLRFIAVHTPEMVKAMQPLLFWAASLPKAIGTPVEGEQPTAFIVVLRPKKHDDVVTYMDIGIALDAMAITAWEQGVGSCIMAAVNRPKVAELLDVPEEYDVAMVLSLGYPSHKSTIVPARKGQDLDYYVDEKRDYYVPKLELDEVVKVK